MSDVIELIRAEWYGILCTLAVVLLSVATIVGLMRGGE